MGTVTISGQQYTIYGTFQANDAGPPVVLSAQNYFGGQLNAGPWSSASVTDRQKALVTATRILDKQLWGGSPVSASQEQAWPRTGATDKDGNAIGTSEIPVEVIFANYELAASILGNAAVQSQKNAGSNTKRSLSREKVGELEVETETEYFAPTSFGPIAFGRFPTAVQEYLRGLLASGAKGATVTGSDDSNFLGVDYGFNDPGL